MKTILTFSLMVILATAAIMPGLQDAFALKADNTKKQAPKSYGSATKAKMIDAESKVYKGSNDAPQIPVQVYEVVKKIIAPQGKIKADVSDKIGPKAYGVKTIGKMTGDDIKTHTEGFEGLKKEQVKNFKKHLETITAQEILKQLYRMG